MRLPGLVRAMLSLSLPSVCLCLIFHWCLRASVGPDDVQDHVTAASFGPILILGWTRPTMVGRLLVSSEKQLDCILWSAGHSLLPCVRECECIIYITIGSNCC